MRIKQQWVQHQVYSYYFNDDRLLLNSGKMAPTENLQYKTLDIHNFFNE